MGTAILVLYALMIFLAAAKAGRRSSTAAFFVNNRASSALGVGLSIIVSCVGASATIGMIGMAYTVGTPAFWWLGAGCFGLAVLSLLLAQKVRETGAYTMPQMVESFLGKAARPIISAVIVVAWMAILAAQFVAITKVLGALTGFEAHICRAIGFLLIVAHTLGGQAAIMRVDRFQALVMLTALLVLLGWLSAQNPGWAATTPIQITNDAFPAEKLVYFLLIVGGNYLVCPMLFGRLLSAKDECSARRGGIIAVIGLALCSVIIVSIGLACKGLLPVETSGDDVLTAALTTLVPGWLNLLISIALVSAIVSSADSCLVTASTVLGHDLLRRSDPKTGRICVLLLGCAGLLVSFWGKGILDYLLMAYDVYVCGVVVPVFIGLLVSRRFFIHGGFACAAVFCGGIIGAASALSGLNHLSYIGMASAALLTLIGLRARKKAGSITNVNHQKNNCKRLST